MKNDPVVEDVRNAGPKPFEESGGTVKPYFEMLRREEAKDKRPIFRRTASRARKAKRRAS